MRIRLLILLIAAGFQFHQLTQDSRFHPDEAYFMTFARHAAVNGDWMLSGALDKPPLSIYISAISMILAGNTTDANGVLHLDPHLGEFAGRLPNVVFAILIVALTMRLAHDLYHDERTTLFAGFLMTTSPYWLAFGATAFTDMSLLFWLVLALWLAIKGRITEAGIVFGLAFWSKPQAIFFLPIIVISLILLRREEACHFLKSLRRRWWVILPIIALLIWDTIRPETSIFLLGTLNNTPDTLIVDPSQYGNRLAIWAYFGAWLIGHPVWTFTVLFVAMLGLGWQLYHRDSRWQWDGVWLVYITGYLMLHLILAFNQYDRYLLLILPPLILLAARGLIAFLSLALRYGGGERGVVMLCLLSATLTLYAGIPIGGDNGKHDGIDDLADYLNAKPVATVIYDRWLGWELSYYMGQWTNKRRVYFPTPDALVAGALNLDEIGDRYLVAPINQPLTPWLDRLEQAGFTIKVDYESDRFIVYRLSVPVSDA